MAVDNGTYRREAVTVKEAQRRIAARIGFAGVERVALADAYGRRLAEPIMADAPLPHFRRSGLDGYAVRACDTAGASPHAPVRLEVIETVPCGAVPRAAVGPGTASRIMTGAAVPDGADAVVMLEMTVEETAGGRTYALIRKEVAAGANVTAVGAEAAAGERLLEAGRVIRAGEAAVLAAFGYAGAVPVARAPRVAIIATGEELLPASAPSPLPPGRVRDSNTAMIAGLVREAGGIPCPLGTVPDDLAVVADTVGRALECYDAVVTSGGVSVGDYDVMAEFCRRFDGELLFDKVYMRPGSPTSAGIRGGRPLFMLSGNPGACFVGFELFVRPALLRMVGAEEPAHAAIRAVLAAGDFPGIAVPRYVRAVFGEENGVLVATPVGNNKSSSLLSIAGSDCLVVVPPGGAGVRKGDAVTALVRRFPPFP